MSVIRDIRIIPAKVVSVDCIRVIELSIKTVTFTSGQNRETAISTPILSFFQ